jgi:hypothetical protein
MPQYVVTVEVEIEARSPKEAWELTEEMFSESSLITVTDIEEIIEDDEEYEEEFEEEKEVIRKFKKNED